jgi:nucleoid-associated protein YgaU
MKKYIISLLGFWCIAPSVWADVRHHVSAGETLEIIAGYYYNDKNAWPRIFKANQPLVKNKDVLTVDWVLTLPGIDAKDVKIMPLEELKPEAAKQ